MVSSVPRVGTVGGVFVFWPCTYEYEIMEILGCVVTQPTVITEVQQWIQE